MGRVLLVEDWDGTREALRDILEHEGYVVDVAANGRQALADLDSNPLPDLILLDLEMPVMNGWDVVGHLHATPGLADVPVVLLSGVETIDQEAEQLGADGYLRKPVDVEVLLQVVRMFCRRGQNPSR
jgi:CheY-like chemotaxis protein